MSPIKSILLLVIFAGFTLLSSCGSDDESNLSRTELLTQKPWKLTQTGIVGIGGSPPESTAADDIYTFSADGTYTFDEGATKEDAGDPQTLTGTWEFLEDETKIRISYSGITITQDIIELSTSTLKVRFNFLFEIENTFGH
ncbi:MAG TPA: hypothetical protein PKJ63_16035 [Cyclobacteriaceae bacterium]|nr:hypothetical protein [Cyclobacteriaceae bacterium]